MEENSYQENNVCPLEYILKQKTCFFNCLYTFSLSQASPPNASNIQAIEVCPVPVGTKDTLDKKNRKIYDVVDDESLYETMFDPPAPPPSTLPPSPPPPSPPPSSPPPLSPPPSSLPPPSPPYENFMPETSA